ncbi:MAG TPA: tannase/feruloyl esterase family alpha/beta hydrolase [Bryobacteraceae bacterium]
MTAKGPDHGIYTALEQWVEGGAAPGDLIATKYIDDNSTKGVEMTRPLCAYPQVANYKGSGDTHDYTSFTCSETTAGY